MPSPIGCVSWVSVPISPFDNKRIRLEPLPATHDSIAVLEHMLSLATDPTNSRNDGELSYQLH